MYLKTCTCGGVMTPTGRFTSHIVKDIPEPRIEVQLYRHHVCQCGSCGATPQGRNDLAVPPDSNVAERDIRSVAATRADGGVNRTERVAKAFGIAKSIVRTCRKNGLNFFRYGLAALQAITEGRPPDLPLARPHPPDAAPPSPPDAKPVPRSNLSAPGRKVPRRTARADLSPAAADNHIALPANQQPNSRVHNPRRPHPRTRSP